MFDAIRNSKRFVQVFLALIILPFAFWGLESYVSNIGPGNDVATVGDSRITINEFRQAESERRDQLAQAMGANFNPAMLDTPAARKALVDQLVNQRVLLLEAARQNIVVSDQTLANFISAAEAFQVNGQFSMERYQTFVQSQGKSQQGFEHELRQDMVLRQLAGAVGDSGLVSQSVLATVRKNMTERRMVQELRLLPETYLSSVKLSDEALKKYYDDNRKEFEEPEQVRLEYVTLSMDSLKSQVKVSEAEVKARYESQKARYLGQEERRASHILIQADPGNAEARAKAKAKATELLAQLRSKPADFGKLARQNSQDPGSATQDGDLGFFAPGMMVKPFEDAAFALKEKEISEVVETEFGYHLIQLTGIKAAKGKTLDEVRPEIEAELKQQAAQRLYAESAENFLNMVYEQSDSLKPVIERFGLTVQTTGWIAKGAPVVQSNPFAHPKLASAIFSDDVVKNKRNTEAVEVQTGVLVSARVLEHRPATVRSFESMTAVIRDRLQQREASALAVTAGEAKLAELRQGKDVGNAWGSLQAVSRIERVGLRPEAVTAVLRASVKTLPAFAGLSVPSGGYRIYRISAVDSGQSVDAQTAAAIDREVQQAVAQEEMNAYLAALRARYEIVINMAAIESR